MRSVWTEERIAALKQANADGLSARQIGDQFGITRNSVIGKLHRLGIVGRRKMKKAMENQSRKVRRKVSARPGQQVVVAAPKLAPIDAAIKADELRDLPPEIVSPNAVTLLDAGPNHCRWPIGEVGTAGFRFCGNHKPEGPSYPYCAAHSRIAFQKQRASSGPRPHLSRFTTGHTQKQLAQGVVADRETVEDAVGRL